MKTMRIALCAMVAIEIVAARAQNGEPTLESLHATRNRPLFSPSRRPPPASQAAGSAVAVQGTRLPTPAPQVELTGVIFGSYQQTAILRQPGKPEPKLVQLGAMVDGWRVTSITPRSIVLTRAKRSVEMQLFAHKHGSE